jgi:hypothetical protein
MSGCGALGSRGDLRAGMRAGGRCAAGVVGPIGGAERAAGCTGGAGRRARAACACRKLEFVSEQQNLQGARTTPTQVGTAHETGRPLSCRPYRSRSANAGVRRFAAQPGFPDRIEFSALRRGGRRDDVRLSCPLSDYGACRFTYDWSASDADAPLVLSVTVTFV